MTSTVRTYRSSDTSAPVLTGSAGALVALLDACLVNGYGSQAGAGWTTAFTGTNKRTYTNSATDGTGCSLYVDDTGPGTGGAREARLTGFQAATGLGTGTGQFPSSAQLAIGIGAVVCRKSATADTTARNWTLVADDTVFYLFCETGDLAFVAPLPVMFGDIFSYKTSDPYRCAIIGRNAEFAAWSAASSPGADGFSSLHLASANFLSQRMIGHYLCASFTGVGGSIGFGKHIDHAKTGTFGNNGDLTGSATVATAAAGSGIGANFNNQAFPYPNAVDGGLYLSPIWVHHNGSVRGYLKGLWAPLQDRPLNHNDTYNGSGNMSGKTLLTQSILLPYVLSNANSNVGQVHIETSNTWS